MLAAITRASILTRAVRAYRADDPVLQHAQQLGLKLQRHLADLVEEDGAAVGRAEQSVARPGGAGESAALVAEHFRLQQFVRNRRAVDRHEGALAPCRQAVDRRCATTSLPVPLSPVISTVASVAATRSTSARSLTIVDMFADRGRVRRMARGLASALVSGAITVCRVPR